MEDNQIQVKFVTKLPEALRVPPTPFAVPARLTRYGLSEVINTILSSGIGAMPYTNNTHIF